MAFAFVQHILFRLGAPVRRLKKADTDTTASLSSPSDYSNISRFDSFEEEFQTAKEEIPVDIFLGVNNDKAILNNKIYQLGLRVKF